MLWARYVTYFLLGMFSFGLQVGLERFLCCIIEPGGKKYGLRLTAVAYSRIKSAGYKVLERIANKMCTKAQPTDGPDDSFLGSNNILVALREIPLTKIP